jgi:DNA repair photolyase
VILELNNNGVIMSNRMNDLILSKVDETGKITISLGGHCPLKCKHCYITAPQFKFQRRLSVDDVYNILTLEKDIFTAICISGDTDPLLDQTSFIELLKMCSTKFPHCNLLFTTRLIPNESVMRELKKVKDRLMKYNKLIFPAVSFVTYRYPNEIEDERKVPSTKERIKVVEKFNSLGIPVLVAMRPTMPFSITPQNEVEKLITEVSGICHSVLGEIFIDDINETISKRLGVESKNIEIGSMTFLAQPDNWVKIKYNEEIEFVREVCKSKNIPFFLRSMSAVEHIIQETFKNSEPESSNNSVVNYEKLLP